MPREVTRPLVSGHVIEATEAIDRLVEIDAIPRKRKAVGSSDDRRSQATLDELDYLEAHGSLDGYRSPNSIEGAGGNFAVVSGVPRG